MKLGQGTKTHLNKKVLPSVKLNMIKRALFCSISSHLSSMSFENYLQSCKHSDSCTSLHFLKNSLTYNFNMSRRKFQLTDTGTELGKQNFLSACIRV